MDRLKEENKVHKAMTRERRWVYTLIRTETKNEAFHQPHQTDPKERPSHQKFKEMQVWGFPSTCCSRSGLRKRSDRILDPS